jgi:hypothetical protein
MTPSATRDTPALGSSPPAVDPRDIFASAATRGPRSRFGFAFHSRASGFAPGACPALELS